MPVMCVSLSAKNSSNVVSNIPPGVTPVMSTPYMIGQVPFFQPPMYTYEDMQLIQQRIPHLVRLNFFKITLDAFNFSL